MIPDFDRDGHIDMQDYDDDLGGAYYFAPRQVKCTLCYKLVAGFIDSER